MEIFENVKVGDEVYISMNNSRKIVSVTKVLKNYFIADDTKFHFNGSQKGGDSWYFSTCQVLTEEIRENHTRMVKRSRRLKAIKTYLEDRSKLSDEQVDDLYNVLTKFELSKNS